MNPLSGQPRSLHISELEGLNARAFGVLAGPGGGKTRTSAEFFHAPNVGVLAFDPVGELARLVADTIPEAHIIKVGPGWDAPPRAGSKLEPLLPFLAKTLKAGGKVVVDLQAYYANTYEFLDPCIRHLQASAVRDVVLVFEECHLYLGEGRTGFSWEACRAFEVGRNWRWGRVASSQRAADVTKRVLERCDTLLLGRVQGYRDAAAMDALLRLNIENSTERDATLRTMRDLPAGHFLLRTPAHPPGVNA